MIRPVALLIAVATVGTLSAQIPDPRSVVVQLAHPRYMVREQAMQRIIDIGEPALPALVAQVGGSDAELSRRCQELITQIELRSMAARLLEVTPRRYFYRDVPLPLVLHDLHTHTGIRYRLPEGQQSLRISADTDTVSPWQAIDRLMMAMELNEPAISPNASAFDATPSITLAVGAPMSWPTAYAGPVRIRALPTGIAPNERLRNVNHICLWVEAIPLPSLGHLAWHDVRIDRAIDSMGQRLEPGTELECCQVPTAVGVPAQAMFGGGVIVHDTTVNAINPYRLPIRLRYQREPGEMLKELTGCLVARVRTPPTPAITVADVMTVSPKTTYRAEGATLRIERCTHEADGRTAVYLHLDSVATAAYTPPPMIRLRQRKIDLMAPPLPIVIEGRFELLDAQGRAYAFVTEEPELITVEHNGIHEQLIVRFQQGADQGEPRQFRYLTRREQTVEIPFRLVDVPLP